LPFNSAQNRRVAAARTMAAHAPAMLAGLALLGLVGVVAFGLTPRSPSALQPPVQSPAAFDAADMLEGVGASVSAALDGAAALEPLLTQPAESVQALAPAALVKTISVGRGDTLLKLLTKAGADTAESSLAIEALRGLYNPKKLQLGQEITLTFARDANDALQLATLNVPDSIERSVSVTRGGDGFQAQEILRELDQSQVHGAGTITSSLYEAALDAGIPMPVLTEMIRLFSYDVDFQREVQKGDSFEVFYEQFSDDDGKAVKTGDIRAAAMTLSGQEIRYYRYAPPGEEPDYFTARGMSVRKALLRTPIDGARLSSGFGMRNHPVMGYSRMHRGVDFAAASGTPIQAAGDGTVQTAGRNGGYGNYVRIRHNSQYSTAYGHMSRIAVKAGQRVRQGQIIGYVGSTGLATGPHLHYETIYNGTQINPLSIRLPTGRKLEGKELAAFQRAVDEVDREIAATPPRTWVALDK
jgi:murein DD-endopeptidase MepM/ murein hydrolase activator NlpD